MLLVPHKLDSFMLWGEQLLAMATKHQTIQVMPIKQLEVWHKVQGSKKTAIKPGIKLINPSELEQKVEASDDKQNEMKKEMKEEAA